MLSQTIFQNILHMHWPYRRPVFIRNSDKNYSQVNTYALCFFSVAAKELDPGCGYLIATAQDNFLGEIFTYNTARIF